MGQFPIPSSPPPSAMSTFNKAKNIQTDQCDPLIANHRSRNYSVFVIFPEVCST